MPRQCFSHGMCVILLLLFFYKFDFNCCWLHDFIVIFFLAIQFLLLLILIIFEVRRSFVKHSRCCHETISAADDYNYYLVYAARAPDYEFEADFDAPAALPGAAVPDSSVTSDGSLESGSLEPVTDVRTDFLETWLFELSTAGYLSFLTLF